MGKPFTKWILSLFPPILRAAYGIRVKNELRYWRFPE